MSKGDTVYLEQELAICYKTLRKYNGVTRDSIELLISLIEQEIYEEAIKEGLKIDE